MGDMVVIRHLQSERREVRLTGCSMMEVAAGEVTVGDAEEETKEVKVSILKQSNHAIGTI